MLDGKEPRHGGGHSVLTAVSVPSQHYLGSALVDQKTNEIPVARQLFQRLDLDGRKVSLDALHTQDQTARDGGARTWRRLSIDRQRQSTHRATEHPEFGPRPAGGFFPLSRPRHIWPARVKPTKADWKSEFCVRRPPPPKRWTSLASNRSPCCGASSRHHRPEAVALVTSLPPEELSAAQWLQDNRAAWGIESGLHQRLDVSHHDDLCRVRLPHSMLVMGMFRRFSNSLCLHWRSQQKKPEHKTTTDFFTAMNAEHHRYAIRCLNARQPSFKTSS